MGFEYLRLARFRAAEKWQYRKDHRLIANVTRVARDPLPHFVLIENLAPGNYNALIDTTDWRALLMEVAVWCRLHVRVAESGETGDGGSH